MDELEQRNAILRKFLQARLGTEEEGDRIHMNIPLYFEAIKEAAELVGHQAPVYT